MVNYGFTLSSLIGLLDILLAVVFTILPVVLAVQRRNTVRALGVRLYVGQALLSPVILLLVGFSLVFQGWRLDPILSFSVLLLHILVIYLVVKDFLMYQGR